MSTELRSERLQHSNAGYSLVSVLIALLLLSVGVLSLSSVLTQSLSMQTVMATRTSALYVAQTHLELLKSQDPVSLASEAVVQVDGRGNPDAGGAFSREVTVASAGRNLMEVVVIVTTPRSTNPIRLVTWVYDGRF